MPPWLELVALLRLEAISYDLNQIGCSRFSTATSPTKSTDCSRTASPGRHTNEQSLVFRGTTFNGEVILQEFDGLISARLYMPSEALGFKGKRPIVYYLHGGPQGQERPDFSWFSMPLIQYLTLKGFAVFVPNVRGSTGYGLSFTKHVDRDWGGQDRLDHVHAMTEILPRDKRLDVTRTGVVGRSYGGYGDAHAGWKTSRIMGWRCRHVWTL